MKKNVFLLYTLVCSIAISAQIPAGYYSRAVGKAEAELKTALFEIINPHTQVSSYNALPDYFRKTDVWPQSSPLRWWDMYGNIPLYASTFNGLNREHSFPKSWWGGTTTTPAYTDLFHLYPAEREANLAKNNYPLGIVTGTPTFDNGMTTVGKGVQSGGAPYVFEPADEYKGDFARTYFYVVTCYQNLTWKYTYMAANGTYPTLQKWAIDLLLDWNEQDPVSQKEIDRNEAVYRIQNNRNPFIDYPELAEYIWGDKMGVAFNPATGGNTGGTPTLTAPVQNMTIDFPQTALGNESLMRLFLKGTDLTGSLELSISGTDAALFTLETKTVSAQLANNAGGYWIPIKFNGSSLGDKTARLRVQDGGIAGSVGVELKASVLPVPTLTKLTALAPTSVTSQSYTARWNTPPASETIDYYIVTRTVFKNGKATVTEEVCENNFLAMDDFDESDSETYSVRSSRLGYYSPESNIITVSHTALDDTEWNLPLAAETYPGGIVRLHCGEIGDIVVYDASGKTVLTIFNATDGHEFTLSPGVYFLTAQGRRIPVKIAVCQ